MFADTKYIRKRYEPSTIIEWGERNRVDISDKELESLLKLHLLQDVPENFDFFVMKRIRGADPVDVFNEERFAKGVYQKLRMLAFSGKLNPYK